MTSRDLVGVAHGSAYKSNQLAAKTTNFTACKICRVVKLLIELRQISCLKKMETQIVLLDYFGPLWIWLFFCVYMALYFIFVYYFVKLFLGRD